MNKLSKSYTIKKARDYTKFPSIKRKSTNSTPIKKKLSKGKLSIKSIIEELNELETLSVEDLLQSVETLEESLLDLPSIEDHIAQADELMSQIENDLEEYLNE
jgi:hypothetical protein